MTERVTEIIVVIIEGSYYYSIQTKINKRAQKSRLRKVAELGLEEEQFGFCQGNACLSYVFIEINI